MLHSGTTALGLRVINSVDPSVLKSNYYIVLKVLLYLVERWAPTQELVGKLDWFTDLVFIKFWV